MTSTQEQQESRRDDDVSPGNGGAAPVAQQNNVHTNLHSRGANFLFLDGHVLRFRNSAYWDFRGSRGITNNPELIWFP